MIIEHRKLLLALALVASFMVFVDGTIVNLTLAQLSTQLHATRPELEWSINAYTLTFAAVMLGAGVITDTLGGKRAFITGLVVFTVASAVCAAAPDMLVLNGARLIQGVGAALLLPSALVLATMTATDEQDRRRLVGWWSAAGGLGMAAGPLLGGVLVSVTDWRAVFAVNVIIGIPAIAASIRSLPTVARKPRKLDVTGMAAATILIAGLVFALIEAPAQGWGSPWVITAFVLAIVGVVAFALAERVTKNPLLPTTVYRDRSFVITATQGALFNFTFYGLLFAMSLMLQQGRGISVLVSGLLFLPLTGLISLGGLGAAHLTSRWGQRPVMGAAQALLTISLVAVALTSALDPLWPMILALLPAGFAAGTLVPTMTTQAISAVPPSAHGAASAAFNTSRQVGAAIGIATFGPVLGTASHLSTGFVICVLAAAAAMSIAFGLTLTNRRHSETREDQFSKTVNN